MGFHWGGGPSQINQVVTVGPGPAPSTAAVTTAAKTSKKSAKAAAKAESSRAQAADWAGRVVAFELVFTNSISKAQLTVRVPAVGAFHDPKRRTTLKEIEKLGKQLATVINRVFHDKGDTDKRTKK